MEQDLKMLSQIDGWPLQSLVRPLSVLVFCLLLTHSCRASDAVFSPVIRLLGTDRTKGGVTLNCESKGWPLNPEVFWLDIEGKVLPSGLTETVKGPDDLYTVRSTVTFEKRHINSFNCRVQQMKLNETRETEIYIADDFFEVQSSSATTVGLAVCLALCILIILLLVFLLWRQNIIMTKKTHRDETDNNCPKSNKTEDVIVTEEESEREPLRTDERVEMKVFNKEKGEKKSKQLKKQQHQEEQLREQQRRDEAKNRVEMLKEELETKKNEVEIKQAELQQLHEEKQRNEEELQNLKEQLENKNKEVETITATIAHTGGYPRLFWGRSKEEDRKKKKEAEKDVETLKKKLETQKRELDTKIKEFEDKQAEVQQLQDAILRLETNLQTLMDELESNNMETESNQAAPVQASSSPVSGHVQFKWLIISRQKFQDEQQRREEAENKVQILEEKLRITSRELEKQLWDQKQREDRAEKELNQLKKLQEERMKREEAEKEAETLKKS